MRRWENFADLGISLTDTDTLKTIEGQTDLLIYTHDLFQKMDI